MRIDINVDRDLCIGSGTRLRLAPGVFATNQNAGAANTDQVRLVASACPTRAITIAEGDARA